MRPTAADDMIPLHDHRAIPWECVYDIDPEDVPLREAKVTHNQVSRRLKSEVKRNRICVSFIRELETGVRKAIASYQPDTTKVNPGNIDELDRNQAINRNICDRHEYALEIPLPGIVEPSNSYNRYWVHKIAQYYGIKSETRSMGEKRIVCLQISARTIKEHWFCDYLIEFK